MSHFEVLERELRNLHVRLSLQQRTQLARYCDELTRWSAKINLTGLHGAEMVRRLVAEPAWIGAQLGISGSLADIGSGNGSPAIPLHLVSGLSETHLIEARARRAAFLRHVVSLLELSNVTVHRTRLEDIRSEVTQVDWITLQGVALKTDLLDSMKLISSPTTTIVWITSDPKLPAVPLRTLRVPSSNTVAVLFQLDLR
jgi:16S rRNA (guanine527-N7)-methyltransferase